MPLLQPTDSLSVNVISVFSDHLLHSANNGPLFRNGSPSYWPAIILFLVFAIYVYINIVSPKKLLQVFHAVYSNQASKQLYREDYRLGKSVSVLLSAGFVLTIAFLIYTTNRFFGFILKDLYPFKQYLFFVSVILIMYTVKLVSNKLISNFTLTGELNSEYTFNVFVSCQTLGVILLPFAICIQFSKYAPELFLYPAMSICGLFFILRLTRGFIISVIEQNIGVVYIFLYLCALEILPLLVLIKFLLVNF